MFISAPRPRLATSCSSTTRSPALEALAEQDGVFGGTYNIATGHDVSVAEIVRVVGELLGRELTIHTEEERLRPLNSEVHQLLGDATRLREATGWAPSDVA